METGQWHLSEIGSLPFREDETTQTQTTLFLPVSPSFLPVGPGRNCLPSWISGPCRGQGGWKLRRNFFFPGLFPQGKAHVSYVVLAAVGKILHSFSDDRLMMERRRGRSSLAFFWPWGEAERGSENIVSSTPYFWLSLTFLQTTLLAKSSGNQLICVTFCGFYEWTFLKDLFLFERVIFSLGSIDVEKNDVLNLLSPLTSLDFKILWAELKFLVQFQ